jgi:hypothetical protein
VTRSRTLRPAQCECANPFCFAPAGIHAVHPAGPCKEGGTLAPGSSCTTRCADGYEPTLRGVAAGSLACSPVDGSLSPDGFNCTAIVVPPVSGGLDAAAVIAIVFLVIALLAGAARGSGRHPARHFLAQHHFASCPAAEA